MINMKTIGLKVIEEISYFRILRIIKKRPLDINIETITMCPLKCVFCCNRLYKRNYTVMDNALFENIVKQYCNMGGGCLAIGSMQSDFLSDPLLIDRMRIIEKYKTKIWLYSTTPLISAKKYSDDELLYIIRQFDYLQISVEGHDRESYQTMAGVDGFDTFIEQIERVRRLIDENELKVKIGIYFRTYDKEGLLESKVYEKLSQVFYIEEIGDSFFSWFGSIKQEDIPEGAKLITLYNHGKKVNCVVPNATLAVQANGRVVGCGCIDWLEKYVTGDCRENTLREIWQGSKAVEFRNAFKKGKLPSICEECGLYCPIDSATKAVSLFKYKPSDGLYYIVRRGGL